MKLKITFERCIQDSQDYGSDNQHMVSRVFFKVGVPDGVHEGVYADLKQTAGSDYETGPIEVGPTVGYSGPFNWHAFAREAEGYFRSLVGSRGSGIRIAGGAKGIRMRNNEYVKTQTVEIEVKETP